MPLLRVRFSQHQRGKHQHARICAHIVPRTPPLEHAAQVSPLVLLLLAAGCHERVVLCDHVGERVHGDAQRVGDVKQVRVGGEGRGVGEGQAGDGCGEAGDERAWLLDGGGWVKLGKEADGIVGVERHHSGVHEEADAHQRAGVQTDADDGHHRAQLLDEGEHDEARRGKTRGEGGVERRRVMCCSVGAVRCCGVRCVEV